MPLLIGVYVLPLTVKRSVAVASFTVPVNSGDVMLVINSSTVTTGMPSISSSLVLLSVPTLPASSVAVTSTL